MLEEIKRKAQAIANNSNKEIIVGLYRNLIVYHNEFCECNYCSVLKEYVRMKKMLAKFNQSMDSEFYEMQNCENINRGLNYLKQTKEKILELKREKNAMKTI